MNPKSSCSRIWCSSQAASLLLTTKIVFFSNFSTSLQSTFNDFDYSQKISIQSKFCQVILVRKTSRLFKALPLLLSLKQLYWEIMMPGSPVTFQGVLPLPNPSLNYRLLEILVLYFDFLIVDFYFRLCFFQETKTERCSNATRYVSFSII